MAEKCEKHPNTSKENDETDNISDIIENSDKSDTLPSPELIPRRKRLTKTRKKAKSIRKPLSLEKNNEAHVLGRLIQEINKYETETESEETVHGIKNNQVLEKEAQKPIIEKPDIMVASTSKQSAMGFHDAGYTETNQSNLLYRGTTEPVEKTIYKNDDTLYAFYLIQEILNFTPNNFPKNGSVQLIGRFEFCEKSKAPFLSFEKNDGQTYRVKIDLREMSAKPDSGEAIILLGTISFEDDAPVIVGRFFKSPPVCYQRYTKLMLRLRKTMPPNNFNKVCVDYNDFSSSSEETSSEEYSNEKYIKDLMLRLRTTEPLDHFNKVCVDYDDLSSEETSSEEYYNEKYTKKDSTQLDEHSEENDLSNIDDGYYGAIEIEMDSDLYEFFANQSYDSC